MPARGHENASQGRNNRETFDPYGRPRGCGARSLARRGGAARRAAPRGHPRLLLLEDGAAPPLTGAEDLEDWIRLPADDLDLRGASGAPAASPGEGRPAPALDDDGVLRLGDRWVSLPPVEARLTAALLDRYGAVVSRRGRVRAGRGAHLAATLLDAHMLRLRRRLLPRSRSAIPTVRPWGYLLERRSAADAADAERGPGFRWLVRAARGCRARCG